MSERLTLDDVWAARERIRPHLAPTPLPPSFAAPEESARPVAAVITGGNIDTPVLTRLLAARS